MTSGYDAESHQKEFFLSSNPGAIPDASYHYDGEGRRVKKIAPTETTVFVYNASGQLVAEYSTQISQTPQVSYLTTDHLGSPRVVTDQNGVVISRKDFSAFGEETTTPERTQPLKYQPPNIRQDYTGYEKDSESGLEFAQARYYNSTHGRFTSADPLTASASIRDPQTFNRYSYVLNSPYKSVDPLGPISSSTGACGQWCKNSVGGSAMGLIGLYSDNGQVIKIGHDQKQTQTPAQQAPNPVKIKEESNKYKVQGKTARDAVRDANRKAKKETTQGRAGETSVEVKSPSFTDADFKFSPDAINDSTGEVTVTVESINVTLEATITTTLPEWSNRDKAPENERTLGDGYFTKLADFEAEHSTDIKTRLNEYRDDLIGLRATGSGRTPQEARAHAAMKISTQINAAGEKFRSNYYADADKRHANNGHTLVIR